MKKRLIQACAIALLTGGLLAAAGCSNKIDGDWARSHMSDEVYTLSRSHQQHKNDVSRAMNLNARQITDDIDFIMFFDRARRGSIYHIPQ